MKVSATKMLKGGGIRDELQNQQQRACGIINSQNEFHAFILFIN
jgi:hypothetical protein